MDLKKIGARLERATIVRNNADRAVKNALREFPDARVSELGFDTVSVWFPTHTSKQGSSTVDLRLHLKLRDHRYFEFWTTIKRSRGSTAFSFTSSSSGKMRRLSRGFLTEDYVVSLPRVEFEAANGVGKSLLVTLTNGEGASVDLELPPEDVRAALAFSDYEIPMMPE